MESKKIVHLHLKTPFNNETEFYFGSVKAIFDLFDRSVLGVTYDYLVNSIRIKKGTFENKKILVRIGEIYRKQNNKTKDE